jgi:DNA-binding PadR family transcriptional regulator
VYADNTLTPREAVRLCALGTLASGPRRYSDLAGEIRHFTSHVLGPSLDVMGTSIELLKYEGLVTATEGKGLEDNAVLTISDAGQAELATLLTARIRAQSNDMNKLIMALKFRFLHLLPKDDQLDQIDLLLEAAEGEAARLQSLRDHHAADPGLLNVWLDHDIDALEQRIRWLTDMSDKLEAEGG